MGGASYHRGMLKPVCVHLLPDLVDTDELRDGVAVVVDVLRASATILEALASGAEAVVPCQTVDEAQQLASQQLSSTPCLLGGERDGVRIPGFDLGNSPREYDPATVTGRTIVFTTTNGTRALRHVRQAERILVATFANRRAVVEELKSERRSIHVVCAGTDGQITAEDCLCAGALVAGLRDVRGVTEYRDDAATLVETFFRAHHKDPERMLQILKNSRGGRNLIRLGFGDDIPLAARCDIYDFLAEYLPATNRIERRDLS